MRACREAVLQASPSEELAHIQAMLIYGCVHIIVKGLISGSQDVRVRTAIVEIVCMTTCKSREYPTGEFARRNSLAPN